MTQTRGRRRSAIGLVLGTALIAGACGGPTPSTSPATVSATPSAGANQSTGPFEALAWPPPGGGAPCDQAQPPDANHAAYAGLIRRIRALDSLTVEFRLCAPDVAFPTRLAFPAFAINDSAWLESHVDPGHDGEQSIVGAINGTGPFKLEAWDRASDVALVRNDAYRGVRARSARLVIRWRDDAGARLAELQAGSVDGADDLGPGGLQAVEADVSMQAVPRAGLNTFYVGFNSAFAPFDNPKVRRAIAMGIDRERIVQDFYPTGSEVATHFSPCAIAYGCSGNPWYEFDPAAAKQLMSAAGYPDGFSTTIQYRATVRPYLPDPTGVATALQTQLLDNLGIRADLEVVPEETFLATVDEGRADGIHLLGRSFSLPEVSSVLDPHFGANATREFGEPIVALVNALTAGTATVDDGARTAAFTDANNAIRTSVPMVPIAHAGTLTAYRADVEGALASPVREERFADMTPGDRRQLVWLTVAEPHGLYCADETAASAQLVCAQAMEGLYAFEPGGASAAPALALGCEPNPELTTWMCTLRPGVTFHDGSSLDANDVVLSFAAQWDADHPLHRGGAGVFQPFIDTFRGLLNPPS